MFLGVLLFLAVISLARFTFFESNNSKLEISLIASFNEDKDSQANLLEQGIIDGLNSIGMAKHFSIKHLADDQTRQGLAANKESLEKNHSVFTMVGPLSRLSASDYPDIAEELKIPLIIPRSTPKELQDPEWSFSMQPNMFTKSGLVSSLLLKDIKPKRIGVVINAEDRGSPYFTGVTQTLLDSNIQVESTELVKLASLDEAKSTNSLVQFDLLYLDLNTDFATAVIKNLKDHNYLGNIVLFDDRLKPNFYREFATFPKERQNPGFYTNNLLIK
jgi:branched-chain amino acid transport system substrate-binding protein